MRNNNRRMNELNIQRDKYNQDYFQNKVRKKK